MQTRSKTLEMMETLGLNSGAYLGSPLVRWLDSLSVQGLAGVPRFEVALPRMEVASHQTLRSPRMEATSLMEVAACPLRPLTRTTEPRWDSR